MSSSDRPTDNNTPKSGNTKPPQLVLFRDVLKGVKAKSDLKRTENVEEESADTLYRRETTSIYKNAHQAIFIMRGIYKELDTAIKELSNSEVLIPGSGEISELNTQLRQVGKEIYDLESSLHELSKSLKVIDDVEVTRNPGDFAQWGAEMRDIENIYDYLKEIKPQDTAEQDIFNTEDTIAGKKNRINIFFNVLKDTINIGARDVEHLTTRHNKLTPNG
ncbi:MAG TPA: hypothetical protein VLG38_00215 [Gammaproteobacteria bacterium]|nr:hypothetical protein [Gammaproteobacteria bacterium]